MTEEEYNRSDYDIGPKRYDFHQDLKFGKKGEALVESFLESLSGGAFEVKTDRYRNGRMVIEVEQNPRRRKNPDGTAFWKPSGLMVTKAEWWVYVYTLDGSHGAFVIISVARIKRFIKAHEHRLKVIDFASKSSNPSKGYLLQPEDVIDMMTNEAYDEIRTTKQNKKSVTDGKDDASI